ADAPGVDGVDREFVAQPVHLRLAEPRIREHAALAAHEIEVLPRCPARELLHEQFAHLANTLAHAAEFHFPDLAQFGTGQHERDDLTTERRWIRVIGAYDALELRQHARSLVAIRRDDCQRADALAVERERLRE